MQDALEVTDLSLAAFLSARGFPVLELDGRPGRRIFRFPTAASDACRQYFANATVEARAYADSLRSLKTMIHNAELAH